MLAFLSAALITASSPAAARLDAVAHTRLDPDRRCLLGVYSLSEGRSVIITGDGGKPRGLQYTLSDGAFGPLQESADGTYTAGTLMIRFDPCAVGTLALKRGDALDHGIHLPLAETQTTFPSDGLNLHGKLVLPASGRARFAAVWVEGSNNDPSTDDAVWQYALAQRGIATFVYDKRGTGSSAGALSSDFHARARDTAAAVRAVRRLAPGLEGIGVIGGSQGGWVAPLTATLVPLDFVIAAFTTVESPIAQDKELVEQQLERAGFNGTALAEARELTGITEKIVRSNMRDGFAELEAFKIRFQDAPWLKAIEPRSYTGLFLKLSSAEIRSEGPAIAQGLTFDFEPRPIVETIKPRQLWLLGGRDSQAPNVATQAILRQIQRSNPNVAVVVFPQADHGLIERTETPAGIATAYSARLFEVAAGWINDRKLPQAGTFMVMPITE